MKTLLTYRNLSVAFFAIIFSLTLHGVSHAQTYTHIYVDAVNGVNAPTGRGSAANPYQSITFALLISERNNLPDPWHVHIRPGNYNGDASKGNAREIFPLKLRREMIFEGTTTAEECIIDGQHTGATTVPILSGEDTERVTIRNLTVQNSLRSEHVGGIILYDPTGTKETPSTFENCVIHNNKGGGLWSNMPLILTGNTFSNNGGTGASSQKSIAAQKNTFTDNGWSGLAVHGNSTGDLSENIFQNHRAEGFWIKGTLEATVAHNTFSGHHRGGYVGGAGAFSAGAFTGDFSHNTFTGNAYRAVSISKVTGTITHNTITNSRRSGIFIDNMTGDITHNTVTDNRGDTNSGRSGISIGNMTGDITHNTITNSGYRGISISNMTGDITHNTVIGNRGCGMVIGKNMTGNITHNEFTRNTNGLGGGGGFWISSLTGNISYNIFDSNSAKWSGGFELWKSTNTVEVFNNIFFNNTSSETGNAVVTRHATHFMNNLFMISDELSEGVSGAHTIWLNSPECRFHNNIFSGLKTVIYTEGTLDLPITHNLFHNVKVDFVEQAGNNLGNDLLFWELVAVNATDNLEGDPQLVDPVTTRDFHLRSTSPAINAGTNAFAPEDDFDGVIRPVGATVDIGPYEYGGTPVVTIQDPMPTEDPVDEPVEDPVDEPVEDAPPATPTLKLYWATRDKIQRGDLDGANIEDVLNRKAVSIALDATNGKLYWTETDNGIYRANLADGTHIEQLIDDDIWKTSGGGIALDIAGGKMYWTNGETDSIFRANLNGTNSEELFRLRNDGTPVDIALDLERGKMYWTQWFGDANISRANLDGSNVEPLIKADEIQDVALDVSGGKMYWTDGFEGIGIANLDGSNATSFETLDYIMGGLTLNLFNGTLYWIDGEGAEIRRGNLDGSQQRTILEAWIADIALYASVVEVVAPVPSVKAYPAWDVNEDGKTDLTDLVSVAAAVGTSDPENPRLDVNGDGAVDIQDIILVATHLGEVAGPAAPVMVALPKHFTPETLQQVLDLLRVQDDGSVAFQRAMANLAQLLASLTPKETALLANYPNPFNPETWIPYQLASPADVTLRIYAVDGSLVRTLSLGHKAVGTYQSRSRAAYWDGQNALGEPVASGVYFYTFTAGDFAATRKMLIRK